MTPAESGHDVLLSPHHAIGLGLLLFFPLSLPTLEPSNMHVRIREWLHTFLYALQAPHIFLPCFDAASLPVYLKTIF